MRSSLPGLRSIARFQDPSGQRSTPALLTKKILKFIADEFSMIKHNATGTVDCLVEGRRKYYFVRADIKDWDTWPFPSDAFPIHRGKSRNKKFKKGDKVTFLAIENKGDLRAWKILKICSEDD